MTLSRYLIKNYKSAIGIFLLVWFSVFIYLSSSDYLSLLETIFYSATFGLISAVVSIFNMILFYTLFPSWSTSEQPFRNPRSIASSLFNILAISFANYAYLLYLNDQKASLDLYFMILGLTVLIGLLAIAFIHFYKSNQRLKSSLKKARPVVDHLPMNPSQSKAINWNIRAGREAQNINVDSLLYIESNKNYVKLHFEDGLVTELRITLKEVQQSLSEFDFLIRCHRSFIVNMNKVEHINGNSTGYEMCLRSLDMKLNASRTYVSAVKNWLEMNKKTALLPA